MNFIPDFSNKNIIITGATSGIGWETACRYIAAGGNVIAIGRNTSKGQELEQYAASEKGTCHFYACDFLKSETIEPLCARILAEFPRIDILVNCAGISIYKTILKMSIQEWDDIFTTNVKATFLMCRSILPSMRTNKNGHIVNIGSTAGVCGAYNLHSYAATKGAVIQLTRSLAAEYSADNVIINCVCPGATATNMCKDGETPDEMREFLKRFPLGRFATPAEIASIIMFVSSDEASNMAGSIIMDDGGFSAI